MSEFQLPPIQAYHPTTFQERGVLIPFTTPLLEGTRARPGDKSGLELVIPNPSGGPGVYILGWNAIPAICRPTLHDRQLSERIAAIPNITPSTIRRVARSVAAEGLAGEDAMEAALAAGETEKNDRTVTNFLLLMALVDQVALFKGASGSDEPDLETRARASVARIAPRLGRSPDWIASALESLGDVLAPVGFPGQPNPPRVTRSMSMLRETCADLAAWSRSQKAEDQSAYVEMICTAADHSLLLVDEAVAQARQLSANLTELLQRWGNDAGAVVRFATRPEWLLDGWEQICLIWRCAQDVPARRSALAEIAPLVPVLPKEARDWSKIALDVEAVGRWRRTIPLNEDWRTGVTVFDLVARNEYIRAATC